MVCEIAVFGDGGFVGGFLAPQVSASIKQDPGAKLLALYLRIAPSQPQVDLSF